MRKMFLVNKAGKTFILNDMFGQHGVTSIRQADKRISVRASLDEMMRGWAAWTTGNVRLQEAFPFLSQDEREFLNTTTLPSDLRVSRARR